MSKSARSSAAPSPSHHRPADPLALAESDGVADQPIKRSHHGFRGVPPPPVFDFDALPDGALLNEYETAAVGRWSTNTLAAWRLRREGHGLRWVVIAGGFVRYRVADIRAFLADATPRKRKPKPPPPAAAPPRRRQTEIARGCCASRAGAGTVTTRRIDKIHVGKRHRKDLGDIDALVCSMADLGLLQPIVIRPDDRLIAGHRRLATLPVRKLKGDAPEAPDNEKPASAAGRVGRFCRGSAS